MAKPILFVTRRLPPAVEARAARDYEARLNAEDRSIRDDEFRKRAEGAVAVLCSPADPLDAEMIAMLPDSVKVIGTFSVGYDHVALDAARARGIAIVNTPDVLSLATAEIAVMLLLCAARRAGEGERLVRTGNWTGWVPTQLRGTLISGKRLGIFGMGRIGREVARMARGFDMEVHYRDVARLPSDLERGAIFHDSDDSFLPLCQFLSLNAPGGASTYHWLNAQRLAKLPWGAVISNAGRGVLVDDAALIAALRSGQVAAAGLDVFEGEPDINPEYRTLDNVFLLPHLGSATKETRDAMGFLALDGIDAVLAGRIPPNIVA
jgi:lactate dehydrogenase-like 2-hydroxyacid dehydrogenase